MRGVIRWFRTPLPLRFWLCAGAGALLLLIGISGVVRAFSIELGAAPPPLSHGLGRGIAILICLTLGGFLARAALRAYPRSTGRS